MKKSFRLVQDKSLAPIDIGQKLTTFRGEVVTLDSTQPPHHEGSTGRVYCRDAEGRVNGWYPSVVGCHFEIIE